MSIAIYPHAHPRAHLRHHQPACHLDSPHHHLGRRHHRHLASLYPETIRHQSCPRPDRLSSRHHLGLRLGDQYRRLARCHQASQAWDLE